MLTDNNQLVIYENDFPFEQIKQSNGDYFHTLKSAQTQGYLENQIWSVVESENNGKTVFVFGAPHHYINVIGFVATKETHDGKTYYEETFDL